jgi:hypothetical protein
VAWLHEIFEHSFVSEQELLAAGLTTEELRALRLLTRQIESRSEAEYFAHIGGIARSSGRAGEIARIVKRLDLADRLEHPRLRADGWRPPYRLALDLLLENESGSWPVTQSPVRSPADSGMALITRSE